jgi:hypothetical protein
MRRLTKREYNNTVRDLFGDKSNPADSMVTDEVLSGFANNSLAPITALAAQQYMDVADEVATKFTAGLGIVPCGGQIAQGNACVQAFIADLAKHAYRRAAAPEELDGLFQLFTDVRTRSSSDVEALQPVVSAILQSPSFLYRPELGAPAAGRPGMALLTGYETASRLSYLLWSTMPDDPLLAAAEHGDLATPAGIDAQARRMLADPRARDTVASFHLQWLGIDLDGLTKSSTVYPEFTQAVWDAAKAETAAFANAVLFEGDARLETLLTAPYSVISSTLAPFYGITLTGTAPQRVDMPKGQRAGVLTEVSVLALTSNQDQPSPVKRGKMIRQRFFCQTLPPPPADLNVKPPALDPGLSTRDRFQEHRANPACASCHTLMDPIGLGFESYDGVGRYQTQEAGKPVDASGEITGTPATDGTFTGALELAQKLTRSPDVQACFVEQWFRFALARASAEGDLCVMRAIGDGFTKSGGRITDVILAIATSDSFRYGPVQP